MMHRAMSVQVTTVCQTEIPEGSSIKHACHCSVELLWDAAGFKETLLSGIRMICRLLQH